MKERRVIMKTKKAFWRSLNENLSGAGDKKNTAGGSWVAGVARTCRRFLLMINIPEFIFKSEKREIMKKLEYYGITDLPFLLIKSGKDKVRGYSGSMTLDDIRNLAKSANIEVAGMYLFHNYPEEIRLSFDAIHLLKEQITKNILTINDEQKSKWLRGEDIMLSKEEKEKFKDESKGFKIIKHKNDFIGTGKLIEDRLVNYMPKERRIKGK